MATRTYTSPSRPEEQRSALLAAADQVAAAYAARAWRHVIDDDTERRRAALPAPLAQGPLPLVAGAALRGPWRFA